MKELGLHYFGALNNCFIEYDDFYSVDSQARLRITISRYTPERYDFAETILPDCKHWKSEGFSVEELNEIEAYLIVNKTLIIQNALKEKQTDDATSDVPLNLEPFLIYRLASKAYIQGLSLNEYVCKTLDEAVNRERPEKPDDSSTLCEGRDE